MGWNVIVRANHGKGAWWSWVKVEDAQWWKWCNEQWQWHYYLPSHACHMQKKHPEIFSATVPTMFSSGYDKLLASSFIWIRSKDNGNSTEGILITKHAQDIAINTDNNTGTSVLYLCHCCWWWIWFHDETWGRDSNERGSNNTPHSSSVYPLCHGWLGILCIYALEMHKSSSYWCPWCLLSWPKWQQSGESTGEERTFAFMKETLSKVRQDTSNKLKPVERKACLMTHTTHHSHLLCLFCHFCIWNWG